jgi:hypothetical protein
MSAGRQLLAYWTSSWSTSRTCASTIGILHHCLTTRQTYDENTAFPAPQADETAGTAAAA